MAERTTRILAFHDERRIRNWFYHGFVLCETGQFDRLRNDLLDARRKAGCDRGKRIHFSNLRSASNRSSRTATAVKWAEMLRDRLYKYAWFFLLGVNLTNIDYEFFGPPSDGRDRDFRIYNRFFEIGLFAACRWFFDTDRERVEIERVFSEKRSLQDNDPFITYAPYRINRRESNIVVESDHITLVASQLSKEKDHPECVDLVNLADVIMGAWSQAIDYTSASSGCTEVADKLFPLCRRLSENPYNSNSRYYKRCAVSFFPKTKLTKAKLMSYGVNPPEDQFYSIRKLRLRQPKPIPGFEDFVA